MTNNYFSTCLIYNSLGCNYGHNDLLLHCDICLLILYSDIFHKNCNYNAYKIFYITPIAISAQKIFSTFLFKNNINLWLGNHLEFIYF